MVELEKGFHFYEGIGKSTGQVALSLNDFMKKVRESSIASIEFHQERGDFAKWIRDVFNEYSLAEDIEKLKERGESLRVKIIETIENYEYRRTLPCPRCGTNVDTRKIWKMVTKPNKVGKKIQFVIGHYVCSNCKKRFRKILGKSYI